MQVHRSLSLIFVIRYAAPSRIYIITQEVYNAPAIVRKYEYQ